MNQRHTRGHDANPLRSPETSANVTVRALGERRGFVPSHKKKKRKRNGGYVEAAAVTKRRTD